MKRLLFIAMTLLVICLPAAAVETVLVGEVVSAATGEPVPGASVYFAGTHVGTATDTAGSFFLRVDLLAPMKLKVSAVGFRTQRFEITPGAMAGMQIALEEKSTRLQEVFVLPGENPALAIMDSVRAHRPQVRSFPEGTNTRCFLSQITPRHIRRRLWRSMQQQMTRQEDSTWLMPVPRSLVDQIIPDDAVPQHFDLYRAAMPLGTLAVLSPLAGGANAYYRYFLHDSLTTDAGKVYRIRFIPANAYDPLLTGWMSVDSTSWRLVDAECTLSPKAGVNYLTSVQYRAAYQDGILVADTMQAVFDITSRRDSLRPFPSLLVEHTAGVPRQAALARADALLPMPLNPAALPAITAPADSLQDPDTPLFRVARWIAYTANTGFMPSGSFLDIGHIEELIHINDYEQLAIGLPFRTNARLLKNLSLEGYVAYGFRDRGIKYKAALRWQLPTSRRNLIGLQVWDRYVFTATDEPDRLQRGNTIGYNNFTFSSFLFKQVAYPGVRQRLDVNRRQDVSLWWEADWRSAEGAKPLVESTGTFRASRIGFTDPRLTRYNDTRFFRALSLSGMVRLGWGERTADGFVSRRHLKTTLPVLVCYGEMGSWSVENQADAPDDVLPQRNLYAALHVILTQRVLFGMGGTLDWSFRAGLTAGRVPYQLLTVFDANPSVTYDPCRLNLLGTHYAADSYVMAHARWNGYGILFNRLPGLRYLHLRELAECSVAWGVLRNEHVLLDGCAPYKPLSTPYVELGIGIGNILRIAEVHALFRVTDTANPEIPWWAIRFRFNLGM